ncbi:hypothetical protein U1Q18_020592 [Sarracenia purpurea var. burkii]
MTPEPQKDAKASTIPIPISEIVNVRNRHLILLLEACHDNGLSLRNGFLAIFKGLEGFFGLDSEGSGLGVYGQRFLRKHRVSSPLKKTKVLSAPASSTPCSEWGVSVSSPIGGRKPSENPRSRVEAAHPSITACYGPPWTDLCQPLPFWPPEGDGCGESV